MTGETSTICIRRWTVVSILVALAIALLGIGPASASLTAGDGDTYSAAWIASDRSDYEPGDTVTLTGGNWLPGEAITIYMNDTLDQSWSQTDHVTADESGAFVHAVVLPGYFISDYRVSATGETSGTATTEFTDALTPQGVSVNGASTAGSGAIFPLLVGPGDPVQGGLKVAVTSSPPPSTWTATKWGIGNPAIPTTCQDHGDHAAGASEHGIVMTAPSTPGTYNAAMLPYGSNDCSTGAGTSSDTLASSVLVDSTVLFSEYFGPESSPDVPFWADENQVAEDDCSVVGASLNWFAALERSCTISTTNANSRPINTFNRRNIHVRFRWGKNDLPAGSSASINLSWKLESSTTWARVCQTGQASCTNGTVSGISSGTSSAMATEVDTTLPAAAENANIDIRFEGVTPRTGSSAGLGNLRIDAIRVTGDAPTAISQVSGSGTYGGTATLTATLKWGTSPVAGRTVAFTLGGASVGSAQTDSNGVATLSGVSLGGRNAGSYTNAVGASFAGDSAYLASSGQGALGVEKASSTTKVTCPPSLTYNGSPQTPCSASVTGAGGLNQSLTVNYQNNTNAGQATASASYAGDGNHTGSSDSANFTIDKAELTVKADDKNMTYADSVPQLTYQMTGFVGGQDLATSGVTGSPVLSTTATSSSAAGPYPITVGLGTLTASNYSFKLVNGTLTVSKRQAIVVYTGINYIAIPTAGNATVNVAATVSRISGNLGDLTKAKVQFAVKKFGGAVQTTVYAMADANGNAATTASVPTSDDPYTVEVRIDPLNQYWASGIDVSSLQVIVGSGSGRTAGGGWIPDAANDINGKSNFGFTVQNAKSGIRGNSLFIYRVKEGANEVQYVVKSNSWQGGGLTFNVNNDPTRATFTGKATVQRYVNGVFDATFASGGHTFTVDGFDGDLKSPRETDGYAIVIRNSSNQVVKQLGSRSSPVTLGGGNVLVQAQ
ncbi:MAG: hypothetical protein M3327_00565 [Actinomycetota bacterium]|nr:hypothetical protein [Actinomycetota bacterium]